MQHQDNGSFTAGLAMAFICVAAFATGYWIRDQGIIFKVQVPTELRRLGSEAK